MKKIFINKLWRSFSQNLKMLYVHRLVMLLGSSLTGLFLVIYIYNELGGINGVLYYSLLSYGFMAITVPLGAILMSKIGQKNSLILSFPFLAIFYLSLMKLPVDPVLFIHLALFGIILHKTLYWAPFHTDFSKYSSKKNRGTSVAVLRSIRYFISIIAPVIAGLILTDLGYTSLFAIVLIIVGLSVLPLLALEDDKEEYSWTFVGTYKQLFKPANRKLLYSYMADGAENIIGVMIWPVFLFNLLDGQYFSIGVLSSVIMLISIIIQMFTGNLVDKGNKKSLLKLGSALYSLGWIFKIFVTTAFQVFIASIYHNFSLILLRTPFNALIYEKQADQGSYVDEYTVLREISLSFGRLIMIALLFLLLSLASLNLSFLLAALVVLAFNFIIDD